MIKMTQIAAIEAVLARAECIYDELQVEQAFNNLATQLTQQVSQLNPVFLCVLSGAIIPMGHLLPRLDFPLTLDYIHTTRYQSGTVGKSIQFKSHPQHTLTGRTVIIFDDILDEGITLQAVIDYCRAADAEKVLTAVLVDKQRQRPAHAVKQADFTGLKAPNRYLFGCGMDYKEYGRQYLKIYALAPADENVQVESL